jgi:phage baseplate assembly protein W
MSSNTSLQNFGTCWSCVSDLTSPAVLAAGNQVVAESLLRIWTTSPGDLIDDPDYGENLQDLLSDDVSTADLAYAQQKAGVAATRDQRVLSCQVQLALNPQTQNLAVNAQVVTAQGPFTLVASVSAITVALLQVSP